MFHVLLALLLACGEKETSYTCTEMDVLQECDVDGKNCVDVEDCASEGLMCHAEMGHCMAVPEDTAMEETGMTME